MTQCRNKGEALIFMDPLSRLLRIQTYLRGTQRWISTLHKTSYDFSDLLLHIQQEGGLKTERLKEQCHCILSVLGFSFRLFFKTVLFSQRRSCDITFFPQMWAFELICSPAKWNHKMSTVPFSFPLKDLWLLPSLFITDQHGDDNKHHNKPAFPKTDEYEWHVEG